MLHSIKDSLFSSEIDGRPSINPLSEFSNIHKTSDSNAPHVVIGRHKRRNSALVALSSNCLHGRFASRDSSRLFLSLSGPAKSNAPISIEISAKKRTEPFAVDMRKAFFARSRHAMTRQIRHHRRRGQNQPRKFNCGIFINPDRVVCVYISAQPIQMPLIFQSKRHDHGSSSMNSSIRHQKSEPIGRSIRVDFCKETLITSKADMAVSERPDRFISPSQIAINPRWINAESFCQFTDARPISVQAGQCVPLCNTQLPRSTGRH